MSRKPSAAAGAPATLSGFDIQRVRVNREGYDDTGAYWGAGPDVFIVRYARLRHDATSPDGSDEITVRARSKAEARSKIAAELARTPAQRHSQQSRGGEHPADDSLGGHPPRKTRYEIDWNDPASGQTVRLRITHSRDYLSSGSDHVEVESIRPKRAALPITETGYRSHFMPALDLINAGGPVVLVRAWLDSEAKGKDWQRKTAARAQGDLFQWAEAQGEVGKRREKRKPAAPAAKPRRRATRDRTPS